MQSRLLFSRQRRPRWPRKPQSFIRVVAVSADSVKSSSPIIMNSSSLQLPHLAFENLAASTMECLRENFASYSTYEILGYWVYIVLYDPFGFAKVFFRNYYNILTNLPPLVTMVILPITLIHLLCYVVQRVLDEYQTFLDLGRGGTPSTPMGLLKVTIKKYFAGVDVLEPPHVPPMLEPYRGVLFDQLNERSGPRPTVKGVAPQRQFDQKTSHTTFNLLLDILKDAAASETELKVTTSFLEGHTDALKANFAHCPRQVLGTDGEWDYEIAHPHRNDGSLHAILHPEDVRTVIEKGWGERHPLATEAWWWKVFYHQVRRKRRPVPYNLVLIYAPRTQTELDEVKKIIHAAVWFHKEKNICDQISLGQLARADCGSILTRETALKSNEWVEGPDGRLITLERALDQGLYKYTACGTAAYPTFESKDLTYVRLNACGTSSTSSPLASCC